MCACKQLLLLPLLLINLLTVQGQPKVATEVAAPVKMMIMQIKAGQDAQALKQREMSSVAKYLLGDYYSIA